MPGLLGFDPNDPGSYSMLGLIQGLGQAAMPSRLPVPTGAALGMGAGGMLAGSQAGAQARLLGQQGQLYGQEAQKNQIGNMLALAHMRLQASMFPEMYPNGVPDSIGNVGSGMGPSSSGSGGLLGGWLGNVLGGGGPSSQATPVSAPVGGNSGPLAVAQPDPQHAPVTGLLGGPLNSGAAAAAKGSASREDPFAALGFNRGDIRSVIAAEAFGVPEAAITARLAQEPIQKLQAARQQIAAANPRDPTLGALDAAIAHAAGAPAGYLLNPQGGFSQDPGYLRGETALAGGKKWAEAPAELYGKGFATGPNGMSAVTGGPADPRYLGTVAGQEAWAKAPAQEAINQAMPRAMRGPGSVVYDPLSASYVQTPMEITEVDPRSGKETKRFIPLGLSQGTVGGQTAGGPQGAAGPFTQAMQAPLSPAQPLPKIIDTGALAAGNASTQGPAGAQPGGGGNVGGAPAVGAVAGPGSAAPPGAAGPASAGVMTKLPPARLGAEEKLGEEFGDRDKKAYDAANVSLASLYNMNASADKMAQQGGWLAPGASADFRAEAARTINSWQQIISPGSTPTFDPETVGKWEEMAKETKRMGMQLVNQMFGGQREAATIVQGATNAVPSAENTYLGYRLVSSGIEQSLQRERDLYNFKANLLQNNQGLVSAEADFNKANPPGVYTKRAIVNAVPDSAVAALRSGKGMYNAEFDRKYGTGMSAFILGGGRTGMGTAGGFAP